MCINTRVVFFLNCLLVLQLFCVPQTKTISQSHTQPQAEPRSVDASVPAPEILLGKGDLSENRKVQLGMAKLYPDRAPREAYTNAMMPAVRQAKIDLENGKTYSEMIDSIAEWSAKVNALFGSSSGFGYFRYDPEGQHPEILEILGGSFYVQPFSTAVFKSARKYGLMIPLLDRSRSEYGKNSEGQSFLVQHGFEVSAPDSKKWIPGNKIVYTSEQHDLLYAKLIHSDPAERKKLGFETDGDLRGYVRKYQESVMKKALDKNTPRPEALRLISEIFYIELTSVFYARGSLGNSVAAFLALLSNRQIEFTSFADMPHFYAFALPLEIFISKIVAGELFE